MDESLQAHLKKNVREKNKLEPVFNYFSISYEVLDVIKKWPLWATAKLARANRRSHKGDELISLMPILRRGEQGRIWWTTRQCQIVSYQRLKLGGISDPLQPSVGRPVPSSVLGRGFCAGRREEKKHCGLQKSKINHK